MPQGVVQWFDASSGEAGVLRGGRAYPVPPGEIERDARHPGARVHFDIERDDGVERAVHVQLRAGTRVDRRQRRFGDLVGARTADAKAAPPRTVTGPLGMSGSPHPLELAQVWARCLRRGDVDAALRLLSPEVVIHLDGLVVQGRARVERALETSSLFGHPEVPEVRGDEGMVELRWLATDERPPVQARTRVAHGRIAELWITESAPGATTMALPTAGGPAGLSVVIRGAVPAYGAAYAEDRLGTVLQRVEEPILFAQVKLTHAPDPARARPWLAELTVDLNGDVVRAQVAGHEPREAIDLLQARLRDQLAHRAQVRQARRRRPATSAPGGWRHGDLPTPRPDWYDRPVDERMLLRHKAFPPEELTVDEAAFDLEQLDLDFYLFHDLGTGEDALLERRPGGGYRLQPLHPVDAAPGPTAADVEVSSRPVPWLTVEEAVEHLGAIGERHLFFERAGTGRGNVVYVRYDGHYGLLTLED